MILLSLVMLEQSVAVAHAQDLVCGVAQTGTCQSATDVWTVTMPVDGGMIAAFTETGPSATGAVARLYQSDCTALIPGIQMGGSGDIDGEILPAGEYCMIVSCPVLGAEYLLEFAAYDASGPACDGSVLTCGGGSIAGTIDGADVPAVEMLDSYSFVAVPGTIVEVNVADTGGASFTPSVGVIGANGASFVTVQGAGSFPVMLPAGPPCPQTYSLIVWNGAGPSTMHLPGAYTVEIATCTSGACGDGTLCGGEVCDDGNTLSGDCCAADCTFETNGSACGGDGVACTVDACDGAGSCVHTPSDLGCGVCEGCDAIEGCIPEPQTAPLCKRPTRALSSTLILKNNANDARDVLTWKWTRGESTTTADLGNPTVDDDYALCVYDESGGSPEMLLAARAPAGETCGTTLCWKGLGSPAGSKGHRYTDRLGTPDGLARMTLKPGALGKAQLVVSGKGVNLKMPGEGGNVALPAPGPVAIRAQLRGSGECWEATYSSAGVSKNSGTELRARSD